MADRDQKPVDEKGDAPSNQNNKSDDELLGATSSGDGTRQSARSNRSQRRRTNTRRHRRLSIAPLESSSHLPPDSVDNVSAQTGDVVESFMAFTYERQESASDREMDDPAASATKPEVPHCFHLPHRDSKYSEIGRNLARIGDDMDRRYGHLMDEWISDLHLTADTTFEAFTDLVSRVLGNDFSWGRVVALMTFGFRMAMHSLRNGLASFVNKIVKYIVKYIITSGLVRWIANNGGWRAVEGIVQGTSTQTIVAISALCLVSIVAVWYFNKK